MANQFFKLDGLVEMVTRRVSRILMGSSLTRRATKTLSFKN